MDEMKRILFEDPTYLYVALAVAELVLAGICYERRSKRLAILLAVPVLLAGAVFAIERTVVTDREQIIAAFREIVADIEKGNTAAFEKYVDDEFSAGAYISDKESAVNRLKMEVKKSGPITRIKINRVVVDDAGATRKMRAGIMVVAGEYKLPLLLNLYWIKRGDEWRIIKADEVEMGVEF